jgi:hypothetical protein
MATNGIAMGGSSKNSTADGRADLEGGKHVSPSKKASFEAREARHYRALAPRPSPSVLHSVLPHQQPHANNKRASSSKNLGVTTSSS